MAEIARTLLRAFLPLFILLFMSHQLTDLVVNSYSLSHGNVVLRQFLLDKDLWKKDEQASDRVRQLEELDRRVRLYEEKIQQSHLYMGMVVNRQNDGTAIDICDSLLFSAIRFAALKKLAYRNSAEKAWEAIRKSSKSGKWLRHPACHEGTSRDMLIGLLIALSQEPEGEQDVLKHFFRYLSDSSGFFGDGPMYVSYLTPGLAESFRRLARIYPTNVMLPAIIRHSFSTLEMDVMFTARGYRAHLIALQIWIEMEIMKRYARAGFWRGPRSILRDIGAVLSSLTPDNLYWQRHMWITQKLVELDPENLFFRWLRMEAGGLNTPYTKMVMLRELLSMPQFPSDELPKNCDRKADYLWQRSSEEFVPFTHRCTMQFSGVDFLWMAALLVGD
ncbi:MAG: hypothetical protein H6618_09805 [Deltaproteobacteria bacterium]|nr:hypothetical protein [Deltaproteobacteria bacterium]